MYKFGQFRRSSNSETESFLIDENYELSHIESDSAFLEDSKFEDPCIKATLTNGTYYYLKFSVTALSSDQVFNLKLTAGDEARPDDYIEQFVQSYKVPENNNNESVQTLIFETVIAPNSSYDKIVWKLQRTSEDYVSAPRKMSINILAFKRIQNQTARKKIKKLGVQGPPSMLMCINGEPIRIGRNGIYEINNPNINIDFVSFIPKPNDFFIMDYQYEEGE